MIRVFRSLTVLTLAAATTLACSREPAGLEIAPGSEISIEKRDGVNVVGRLVAVEPQAVVLQTAGGEETRVARTDIKAIRSTPRSDEAPRAPEAPQAPRPNGAGSDRSARAAADDAREAADAARADAARLPVYREVTIPAGTVLPIELRTSVGSETSQVEDQVRGALRRPVTVDGVEVVPAGTPVLGNVTAAERSGRVKGVARVAFRFALLDLPGDGGRVPIRTDTIAREAEATKKQDAAKIGGAAAAGAVIGGLIGGGDGAAKGAAIGGGAGTGVVLSTRGKEVVVPAGTAVSARLSEPVRVRVRVS